MYGPQRLLQELTELGHPVVEERVAGNIFLIIPQYEIELGRFLGRVIDLGIQATGDYPRTVASSIHVRATPQLFEKTDSAPKVRNIIDSPLGSDWRYWSLNFGWTSAGGSARRLLNQIKGVFRDA